MQMTTRQVLPLAVHLVLIHEDRVLWLRRHQTGWMDGHFSVPAGHVEQGESALEAMCREASEEIGVRCSPADLRHVLTMHRASDTPRVDLFFRAVRWEGTPTNCEPKKCSGLQWAPLTAAPSQAVPYVRRAIDALRAGEAYVEFGWGDHG